MSKTTTFELKNIDPDDVADVLKKVEKSFGFTFGKAELKDVKTFGELCDIITSKVEGINLNDCTTQQTFYKVRNAISTTMLLDAANILPDTQLQNIFSQHNRRKNIGSMQTQLGFKTKILRPRHWITLTLFLALLTSIVGLFMFWKIGLAGLAISIIGLKVSDTLANQLDLQTVGQLADKISREYYIKSRRNSPTINKHEIPQKIKELFKNDLDLEDGALTRQATFV